jgi:cytochrome c biogenesis protein CcmG/thiol:disulfide interchange protein DsbE
MKYAILIISLTTIGFFFLKGLSIDPSVVPSNLLSHDTPSFKLEKLPQKELLQETDFLDKNNLKLLNFFATWCPPCKVEHPQLMEIAKKYALYGIAKKDDSDSIIKWLKTNGDPFKKIGLDKNGTESIKWGVYGLPETFVINKEGKIIYKHIGPILKKDLMAIENILSENQ